MRIRKKSDHIIAFSGQFPIRNADFHADMKPLFFYPFMTNLIVETHEKKFPPTLFSASTNVSGPIEGDTAPEVPSL